MKKKSRENVWKLNAINFQFQLSCEGVGMQNRRGRHVRVVCVHVCEGWSTCTGVTYPTSPASNISKLPSHRIPLRKSKYTLKGLCLTGRAASLFISYYVNTGGIISPLSISHRFSLTNLNDGFSYTISTQARYGKNHGL